MDYYADISPWSLDGQPVNVVDNNEHLGLIVSGSDEEGKNIDENIHKCRNSLFGLLGPAFAFKCLLSPSTQVFLWRMYSLPSLRSGLSSLPIRPANLGPLKTFHNKILRSFLKLSQSSPIPALHFLLGELPIEGWLHLDLLSLFYNIWNNPSTTMFDIAKYLLKMASSSSLTWSAHLRNICIKYSLPDPLQLLSSGTVWKKIDWSTLIKTKITVYYEKELRQLAQNNSKMEYLNVQVQGLSGLPHPALRNILTTRDVLRLRQHIKFLSGDYLTADRLFRDNGTSPRCKLCPAPFETTQHVLTQCRATEDTHSRMLPELLNIVASVDPSCEILDPKMQPWHLRVAQNCKNVTWIYSLNLMSVFGPRLMDCHKDQSPEVFPHIALFI